MYSALLLLGTAGLCLAGEGAVTAPKELERLDDNALDSATREDPSQDPLSRVARHDPGQDPRSREARQDPGQDPMGRVARQDPGQDPRLDPFYPMAKSHHLLQKLLPSQPAPPPVYYQPPPPQPQYQARPPPPPPQVPCLPAGSVQVAEGHIANPQSLTSYSAHLPYISGYRLTPIIGHKQIVVNDVAHSPGAVPCVDGSYTSYSYGHARNAEDFLKPFEDAGYFMAPPDTSHQLRAAQDYQDRIDDLNSHAEHLESLRNNAVMVHNS